MKITEITPVMRKKSDKIRLAPYCRVSSDDEYTTGRKTNSKFVK